MWFTVQSYSCPALFLTLWWALCFGGGTTTTQAASTTHLTPLMDATGRLKTVPQANNMNSITTVITSPGTPSSVLNLDADAVDQVLLHTTLDNNVLVCRGATLGTIATEELSVTCLSIVSTVSDTIIVDGICGGDYLLSPFRDSRHARTLSALFRAQTQDKNNKQTLILAMGDDFDETTLLAELEFLYQALFPKQKLSDAYDVKLVKVNMSSGHEVLNMASTATSEPKNLSNTLQAALRQVRERGVNTAEGLDTPSIASAFVVVGSVQASATKTVLAKVSAWKRRVSRGLLVDHFGKVALALRVAILQRFDSETLVGAGYPTVASYRLELRSKLLNLLDANIQQVFYGMVENLEKASLKRLHRELLKNVNSKDSVEKTMDTNAAAVRKELLLFETVVNELQLPELGLTTEKVSRDFLPRLNDAVDNFPDSAAAKIKRSKAVKKTVNKEKKPSEFGVAFGLDLVAMLRPDGFGSLQGYAGYNLPGGNSITVGVHNDADDPQVIAQFGGVRPPLLRVQPKLRVDVEM